MRYTIIFLLFSLMTAGTLVAQNSVAESVFGRQKFKGMLKNDGQIFDMNGEQARNVLFYLQSPALDVFVTTSGITYNFKEFFSEKKACDHIPIHESDTLESKMRFCRVDMTLRDASIIPGNIEYERLKDVARVDYYKGNISKQGYQDIIQTDRLLIRNVYPFIDWEIIVKEGNVKHNFIVRPGGDINKIRQEFSGAGDILLNDDGIEIRTELGSIREGKVKSWFNSNSKIFNVKTLLEGNTVRFLTEKPLPAGETLVIDPPLAWSTYYGGSGNDDGHAIERDFNGNIYIAGKTTSADFPKLSLGGLTYYQGTISTNNDAFIAKFTENGVQLWSSYYGGNADDDISRISLGTPGMGVTLLFAVGTTSSTDFSTFNPGGVYYDNSANGGSDGFALAFANEIRTWATYYGGSGNDAFEDVAYKNNRLVITGNTLSNNFPTLNPGGGAFYQSTLVGVSDPVILEFTPTYTLVWSSYYGGDYYAGGTYVDIDLNNNIFTAGFQTAATTPNLPLVNPGGGAYQQSMSGTQDWMIQKFNSTRSLVWRTYLGGSTNTTEQTREILVDSTNRIFIIGGTYSSDFPCINNVGASYYQPATLGSGDAILAVFSPALNYVYGTRFGGTSVDYCSGITIDKSKNLYITGETASSNFTPRVNPNDGGYYQNTYGGAPADGFIIRLDSSYNVRWGTYFGGSGEDRVRNMRVNSNYHLFITGYTKSTNFPTANYLSGSYFDNTLGSAGIADAFVARFIPCPDNFTHIEGEDSVCYNSLAQIVAVGDPALYSAYTYLWNTAETNDTISHGITADTWYHVTTTGLYACTERDSIRIIVKPLPVIAFSGTNAVCNGDTAKLTAAGGITYNWENGTVGPQNNYVPSVSEYQAVTVVNSYNCSKTDSIQVTVHALPVFNLSGSLACCKNDTNILSVHGSGMYNYTWSTGLNNDSLVLNSTIAGNFNYWIAALDSNSCKDTLTFSVQVNDLPEFNLGNDTTLCNGQNLLLDVGIPGLLYRWSTTETAQSITVNAANVYSATATDVNTCQYSDTISVAVIPYSDATISPVLPRCINETDTIHLIGAEPGGTWIGTGIANNSIGVFDANGLIAGSYPVEYQIAGICGDTGSVVITLNPAPVVDLGINRLICDGDSVSLDAGNAGSTFIWSNGNNQQIAHISTTEMVWVEVNNVYGCKNRDTVEVNVLPWADASITDQTAVCANAGNMVTFTAVQTGGTWSGSGLVDASAGTYNPAIAGPGLHNVIYSIGGLCPDKDTTFWEVYDYPVFDFVFGNESCQGASDGTVFVDPHGGALPYTITLNGNLAADSNFALAPGIYLLMVEDAHHCSATDSVEIKAEDFPCGQVGVFIPNIFSPNADGQNDELKVYSNFVKSMEFVIFDRFGEKVFESNDQTQGWDGTFGGQKVQPGLYVYYLRAVLITGETIFREGNVTLVR